MKTWARRGGRRFRWWPGQPTTLLLVLLLAAGGVLPVPAPAPGAPEASPLPIAATEAELGSWGPVLDWGFQGKHAVVLPTGDVLLWSTGDNARVWSPVTGSFVQTPALFGDLHCAGQVTLADGRVLVVGGVNGPPHVGIKVTALFDPTTGTWTQGQPMKYARWYPTVTTLPDGRVLVTNGDDENGNRVLVPEIYDPTTDTWTELPAASRAQGLYAFMYVLPDGRVYEAGTKTATALLDVAKQTWTAGPTNAFGSSGYSESGAMFGTGKILRAGGGDPAFASAATIDMTAAIPKWTAQPPMAFPRRRHNLPILADGTVMAVGGTAAADDATKAVLAGEIWDPATGTWKTVASMAEPRMYHSTALLLPDGRVLTAGGEGSSRLRAQIYSPPYLFKGPRPTISAAPATASYGTNFSIGTPTASTITSVALLRPSAVTHAIDMNQRYVPLTFSPSGDGLTVQAPADANVAPPGSYLLVIKDANGVPSVARWVRLDSSGNLQPGRIAGHVRRASDGAPVAGATVSFAGGSTTSGGDGAYLLADVAAGEHQVSVAAAGYGTESKAQTVSAGATSSLDFALTEPGAIAGRVTNAVTGAAVAGATVTHSAGTSTTGPDGTYAVTGIRSGNQTVTASATGYDSLGTTVSVPPNGTAVSDFALAPRETYIAGEVIDRVSLQPLAGAVVSYSGGSTTTDALGRYKLPDAPAGDHVVMASADGYEAASNQVVVTSGSYTTSDFGLDPIGAPPAGSPVKDITFEGGSLLGSQGAGSKTGVVDLDSTRPLMGSFSATVPGTGNAYLEQTFTASSDLYASFHVRLQALPAGDVRLVMLSNAGTTVGNVVLTKAGRLLLRHGSTKVGLPSAPLAVGTTYRIGLRQRQGAGSDAALEAYLAVGDDPYGTPFAGTGAGPWTTAADRLRVGATTSSPLAATVDDIRIDRATLPGPLGSSPPAESNPLPVASALSPEAVTAKSIGFTLSVHGSDFVPGAVVRWNGVDRPTTFGSSSVVSAAIPATDVATEGTAAVTVVNPAPGGGTSVPRTFTVVAPVPPPPPPPSSSTRIKDLTFEAGSLLGASGASKAVGAVALETASPLRGAHSATVPGSGNAYLEQTFTAAADLYTSFHIRLQARPTTDVRVALLSNGGTTVGNLVVSRDGALVLRDGSTRLALPSTRLALGTTYRVGLRQRQGTGGNGLLEAFLATGDDPFGAAFASSATGAWTTAADRLRIGATTSAALHATFDDVRLDRGVMPAP